MKEIAFSKTLSLCKAELPFGFLMDKRPTRCSADRSFSKGSAFSKTWGFSKGILLIGIDKTVLSCSSGNCFRKRKLFQRQSDLAKEFPHFLDGQKDRLPQAIAIPARG